MSDVSALDTFTRTAERAANEVLDSYSTSFGLATRLLGARHRQHIRNVYALVRVADEIVDGVAAQAGLSLAQQRLALDGFRREAEGALASGYSADVVVHAFAVTARASGIGTDLTDPFFAAMAMDVADAQVPGAPAFGFTAERHDDYVFGSAEAVGLMCLRVFMKDEVRDAGDLAVLEMGARQLGAAFQDINFLRDLHDDAELGRSYLSATSALDDAAKAQWVARVRAQLDHARAAIPVLPRDARAAIRCAHAVFSRLVDRIEETPVEALYAQRVRVPDAVKAWCAIRAVVATAMERRR